eukprot:403341516
MECSEVFSSETTIAYSLFFIMIALSSVVGVDIYYQRKQKKDYYSSMDDDKREPLLGDYDNFDREMMGNSGVFNLQTPSLKSGFLTDRRRSIGDSLMVPMTPRISAREQRAKGIDLTVTELGTSGGQQFELKSPMIRLKQKKGLGQL